MEALRCELAVEETLYVTQELSNTTGMRGARRGVVGQPTRRPRRRSLQAPACEPALRHGFSPCPDHKTMTPLPPSTERLKGAQFRRRRVEAGVQEPVPHTAWRAQ